MSATWYTPQTAESDLGIKVSAKQLATAQEQCLRVKGLALTTAQAPSESFAQGVVYQALANRQASQASPAGDLGGEANRVNVTPLDWKILSMLIIPSPDADDPTRDAGHVGTLIG